MDAIYWLVANAIGFTTAIVASSGTSAGKTATVGTMASASTSKPPRRHASSATANWDGSVQAATNVSNSLSHFKKRSTNSIIFRLCRQNDRNRFWSIHRTEAERHVPSVLANIERAQRNRSRSGRERNGLRRSRMAAADPNQQLQKFPADRAHGVRSRRTQECGRARQQTGADKRAGTHVRTRTQKRARTNRRTHGTHRRTRPNYNFKTEISQSVVFATKCVAFAASINESR